MIDQVEYFKDPNFHLYSEAVNLRESVSGLTVLSDLERLFSGDVYRFPLLLGPHSSRVNDQRELDN